MAHVTQQGEGGGEGGEGVQGRGDMHQGGGGLGTGHIRLTSIQAQLTQPAASCAHGLPVR
jgi:hypothetical protein